jgi:hypothetical protein
MTDSLPTPEGTPLADGETERAPAVFDERYKEAFHGLAFLGKLSETFEWFGHKIIIRTLNTDAELALAQVIKPWENTSFYQRAYIAAVVACAVETVDGKGLPTPLGEEDNTYAWAQLRFDYVKARWFRPTIDTIYGKYLELEGRAREAEEELGKAWGQAVPTPGSNESSAILSDEGF